MISYGELTHFYQTLLGDYAQATLNKKLKNIYQDNKKDPLSNLHIGYHEPYIDSILSGNDADLNIFATPTLFGGLPQKRASRNSHHFDIAIDDHILPFEDQQFDTVTLIHALELSYHAPQLLDEVWRILKPDGRVFMAIPNRYGLWSRVSKTPWGNGRPYSRTQIKSFLLQSRLTMVSLKGLLSIPPFCPSLLLSYYGKIDPILSKLITDRRHGLLFVEATKNLYSGICVTNSINKRLKRPKFAHNLKMNED